MAKFPADLAKLVGDRWQYIVSGEYTTPACPSKRILKRIFKSCYLAANTPEEGRYPKFNVVITERARSSSDITGAVFYPFKSGRTVTVEGIRRLAPSTNSKKSAIWITFSDNDYCISGICDLGTSWHRARLGLAYSYKVPSALIVQIDRPGRMKVYQGEFAVASLSDGVLTESRINISLFLHKLAHSGFERLAKNFTVPKIEKPRDFENFWFTALCNVFSAIANSINALGHGGMLVILSNNDADIKKEVENKVSVQRYDATRRLCEIYKC